MVHIIKNFFFNILQIVSFCLHFFNKLKLRNGEMGGHTAALGDIFFQSWSYVHEGVGLRLGNDSSVYEILIFITTSCLTEIHIH